MEVTYFDFLDVKSSYKRKYILNSKFITPIIIPKRIIFSITVEADESLN